MLMLRAWHATVLVGDIGHTFVIQRFLGSHVLSTKHALVSASAAGTVLTRNRVPDNWNN